MRLISFLGTNDYQPTSYVFDGEPVSTRYLTFALATIFRPREISLIATNEAWSTHGENLSTLLSDNDFPMPRQVLVPTSAEEKDLWEMFEKVVEEIRSSTDPVLIDITNGLRMHPFFAAACIEYVQSVLPEPPEIRVVYGEYRKGDQSPIWELTPFLELLSWSRELRMFLRTGQAKEVANRTHQKGEDLSKVWAQAGKQGERSRLKGLAKAIKEFSGDFTTIRTGSMLTDQNPSAQKLYDEIVNEQKREEVKRQLPPLVGILDEVRQMIEPLLTNGARLSSKPGQMALFNLARLYQRMGRYSEAASIIREGWISLGAPENADQPGPTCDKPSRIAQEKSWKQTTAQHLSVAELRNDIQHAGFNKDPQKYDWFEKQITKLMEEWKAAIDAEGVREVSDLKTSSNHVIFYSLGVDQPVVPSQPLPPLPEIPRGALVVIEGRAPIWRYAMAFHQLHGSPAGAIAVYDPRLGAVVVASHHPDWSEGQVIDLQPPSE
jgi:CRISPR-associated protein Csx16